MIGVQNNMSHKVNKWTK